MNRAPDVATPPRPDNRPAAAESSQTLAMTPLVSIIIPCFNSREYVAEAVQSALDQTYPACEIVAVDDGSTDGSVEILRSYGERIRWQTVANRGAPAARNLGLKMARGEYIKFLDADDMLLPGAVEAQVAAAESLPGHAVTYGIVFDYETHSPIFDKVRTGIATTQDEMIFACYTEDLMTSTPLHRRKSLEDVGGFDVAIKRGQEWNLHVRLALHGVLFVFAPVPVYYYRRHNSAHRISFAVEDPRLFYKDIERQRHTAMAIAAHYQDGIPDRLKKEVFVRLHLLGRNLFQIGHRAEAREILAMAGPYAFDTPRIGRLPYRWLRRLLGPYAAEWLLWSLRKPGARKRLPAAESAST